MSYPEKSYYDTLGIPRNAKADQIRVAYREQIKFFHPDVFQGSPEIAEAKTKELNEAYEHLIDPVKRDKYDFWLKAKDYQKAQSRQKAEEAARQAEKQRKEAEQQEKKAQARETQEEPDQWDTAQQKKDTCENAAEASTSDAEEQREQPAANPEVKRKVPWGSLALAICLVASIAAGIWTNAQKKKELDETQTALEQVTADLSEVSQNAIILHEHRDFYKRTEECSAYLKDTFNDMYSLSSIYTSFGDPKSFRQNVKTRIQGDLELVENCYAECEELETITKDDTALLQDIQRLCGSALEYLEQFGTAKPPVEEIMQKASSNAMDAIAVMYTARGYYWELTNPE